MEATCSFETSDEFQRTNIFKKSNVLVVVGERFFFSPPRPNRIHGTFSIPVNGQLVNCVLGHSGRSLHLCFHFFSCHDLVMFKHKDNLIP